MSALYERPGAGGIPVAYHDPALKGQLVRCAEHGAHVVTSAGRVRRLSAE
jgi:hypothetical protein